MTKTAAELLGEVSHYMALGQANYARALAAHLEYEKALGMEKAPRKPTIKCLRIWGEWLAANGPATRAYITGATGERLTERATPHTIQWTDDIDPTDDLSYPPDTIMRIRSLSEGFGRGAPPTVYFLWSQRFDVREKFGVGPERPDETTVLGVIQPPHVTDVPNVPGVPVHPNPITDKVYGVDPHGRPRPDVDEWIESHAELFRMIGQGIKPDAEQRTILRSDCPNGVDANVAIMLAAQGRLSELTA